jgi:hypothetical protein
MDAGRSSQMASRFGSRSMRWIASAEGGGSGTSASGPDAMLGEPGPDPSWYCCCSCTCGREIADCSGCGGAGNGEDSPASLGPARDSLALLVLPVCPCCGWTLLLPPDFMMFLM